MGEVRECLSQVSPQRNLAQDQLHPITPQQEHQSQLEPNLGRLLESLVGQGFEGGALGGRKAGLANGSPEVGRELGAGLPSPAPKVAKDEARRGEQGPNPSSNAIH